jgi:hypothetical protein
LSPHLQNLKPDRLRPVLLDGERAPLVRVWINPSMTAFETCSIQSGPSAALACEELAKSRDEAGFQPDRF